MSLFIGIDPGLDGAIAVLDEKGMCVGLYDTPSLLVKGGRKAKREYEIVMMRNYLLQNAGPHGTTMAGLEKVHSMPEQGVASSFSFGRGLGLWEGLLAGLHIPYTMITPQRWKKAMMDGMGKEKDASRLRAQQLFPSADLSLKKHHGRADALLIAYFVARQTAFVEAPTAPPLPNP